MIKKQLNHVGLNVADLDKSIGFYEDLFGFSVIEKWDNPKQSFVGTESLVLGLMEMQNYDYRIYTTAHLAFPCEITSEKR